LVGEYSNMHLLGFSDGTSCMCVRCRKRRITRSLSSGSKHDPNKPPYNVLMTEGIASGINLSPIARHAARR